MTTACRLTLTTIKKIIVNDIVKGIAVLFRRVISAGKLTITGGSMPIISMVDMKLHPKKSYSIVSDWALPEHPQWFPDINRIKFYPGGQTQYVQNGKPVMYS